VSKVEDVNQVVQEFGRDIGDYIRTQRTKAQISLRELAKLAGVSNPYLSQIERGLRRPSADILQQIAKGLRISAEVLYVRAGILEQRQGGAVVDAVLADAELTERQKQVLLDIYQSFRRENEGRITEVRPADAVATDATGASTTDARPIDARTTGASTTGASTTEARAGEAGATQARAPRARAAGAGKGRATGAEATTADQTSTTEE